MFPTASSEFNDIASPNRKVWNSKILVEERSVRFLVLLVSFILSRRSKTNILVEINKWNRRVHQGMVSLIRDSH